MYIVSTSTYLPIHYHAVQCCLKNKTYCIEEYRFNFSVYKQSIKYLSIFVWTSTIANSMIALEPFTCHASLFYCIQCRSIILQNFPSRFGCISKTPCRYYNRPRSICWRQEAQNGNQNQWKCLCAQHHYFCLVR